MAIYVRTVGLAVLVTTDWDIRPSAGTLTLAVARPDGEVAHWTLTLINGWDGTQGTARYDTIAGDLSVAGSYTLQGIWVPVGGIQRFMTNKVTMTISA